VADVRHKNPHRLITCPRTPKKKAGRPAKYPNYAARYSSYRKSQGPDFKTKEAARKRTARREASRSRSLSAQYACDELKILKQSCARQTQKIAKLKEKLAELEERLEAAENTPKPAGRCPEEMEVRLPRVALFFSSLTPRGLGPRPCRLLFASARSRATNCAWPTPA
jgi:hypothetical protein